MNNTIIITKKEYIRLKINDEKLRRLQTARIDKMIWYDEAMFPENEPSMEDVEEKLRKEIDAK